MDDVPPGPTAPGPRRPALSVVIPVHNGGRDFERCLRRLCESRGPAYELIVVDDGSTDGSAALAAAAGARVIANPSPRGPASARNRGRGGRVGRRGVLPRRRRRRPPRHPGPGARPVRGRPRPDRPLRLVRRRADRAGTGEPVPQPAPPLHPPARPVRRRRPPRPDVLDRLRGDPPPGLPRRRRVRPPALHPAGDRGHRAGLPADPGRAPDRAGAATSSART